MDSQDLKKINEKINERIFLTKQEIKDLKQFTAPIEPENAIGRISRMDAINNKSINDRALRKAEEKLKKLKNAISRINDSDFGKCRLCNSEIQEGRLLLIPESNICVKCA